MTAADDVDDVDDEDGLTAQPAPETTDELHPARRRELEQLAHRLGHRFHDLTLLERALCHSSTGNQRPDNYERLEFLGDAILGFVVADELFRRTPEIPEGELTDRRAQIVSRLPLARVADRLELVDSLVGGRGLRDEDRRSRRILADLVEAVCAAIYLDGGMRAARAFVKRHLLPHHGDLPTLQSTRDPKSRLLHYAQIKALGQPRYELLEARGPDHEREFEVGVLIRDRQVATGCGRSKQAAEKQAAARALEQLKANESASS